MTLIRCPWPPTELRPNFRDRNNVAHIWRPKAKAYKDTVWKLCLEQNVHITKWPKNTRIKLVYTFHAPKGCRWDKDARESAFKWGQDAIADTMRVDDRYFDAGKIHGDPVEGGCVMVRIVTEGLIEIPLIGSIS